MLSEACSAVGNKVHEYAPGEIRNSMVLTLMKKALMVRIGGRCQKLVSL